MVTRLEWRARLWRVLPGAGAGLIACALLLEGWLVANEAMRGGATLAAALGRYLGFFTVLTNGLVVAMLGRAALRPEPRAGLSSPRLELLAVTSILLVGGVYNLLLASRWHLHGLRRFDEVVLHDVSPVLFLLYWLLRPHGELRPRDAGTAVLWPLAYASVSLLRGGLDGFFPYHFLDPTRVSWPRMALHLALLHGVVLVVALALVRLDRRLAARR
jgi:hypothetical protein